MTETKQNNNKITTILVTLSLEKKMYIRDLILKSLDKYKTNNHVNLDIKVKAKIGISFRRPKGIFIDRFSNNKAYRPNAHLLVILI